MQFLKIRINYKMIIKAEVLIFQIKKKEDKPKSFLSKILQGNKSNV